MKTATGFEYFAKAIESANTGKPYNPVIKIGSASYTFYKPTLQDIEIVTKAIVKAGVVENIDISAIINVGIEMFSDIHMKMELVDMQGGNITKRAVQKSDLDALENQAHVNLFRNLYLSLCLFFILRSDGYTITF